MGSRFKRLAHEVDSGGLGAEPPHACQIGKPGLPRGCTQGSSACFPIRD